jgi:hypothetical protein
MLQRPVDERRAEVHAVPPVLFVQPGGSVGATLRVRDPCTVQVRGKGSYKYRLVAMVYALPQHYVSIVRYGETWYRYSFSDLVQEHIAQDDIPRVLPDLQAHILLLVLARMVPPAEVDIPDIPDVDGPECAAFDAPASVAAENEQHRDIAEHNCGQGACSARVHTRGTRF